MIKTKAIAKGTNSEYHWASGLVSKEPLPVITTEGGRHGVFKSVSRSTAGTTTITEPELNGSIILTDLIVSSDKTNASTVTIRFTDGTNTVNVAVFDSGNAPVATAISFTGLWQGWKNARLELVTVANVTVTTALGYLKVDEGLQYADWDNLR